MKPPSLIFAGYLASLASAPGCGAVDPRELSSDVDPSELVDEAAPEETFDSLATALSTGERCHSIAAANVFDLRLPYRAIVGRDTPGDQAPFVSPRNYNPAGCAKAYIVDVTRYQPTSNWIRGGTNAGLSEGECRKRFMNVYAWEQVSGGSPIFIGASSKWAQWTRVGTFPRCEQVLFSLENTFPGKLVSGRSYRFASSARVYSVAGDTKSSFTTASQTYGSQGTPTL